MTWEPSASIWAPMSYGPRRSSRSRASSGLWITPDAMACASLATRPMNEMPGPTTSDQGDKNDDTGREPGLEARAHEPR